MRRVFCIALVSLLLLPALAGATVTCTASDEGDGRIRVTTTTDGQFEFFNTFVGMNSRLVTQDCAQPNGDPTGNNPCFWEAEQLDPGPATAEVPVRDQDGNQTCGPFDNMDGLPVELIEISVE